MQLAQSQPSRFALGGKDCLMEGKQWGKLLLRAAASPPRVDCRNVQRSEGESRG